MNDKNEKIWLICGVIVEHQDKFLIIKQARGAFHEKKWAIPGGKIEPKMSIFENAKREVLEETGLEIEITNLVGILKDYLKPEKSSDPEDVVIFFLYHGKAKTNKVQLRQGEISDYKWLTLNELETFPINQLRPIMPSIFKLLRKRQKFPLNIVLDV